MIPASALLQRHRKVNNIKPNSFMVAAVIWCGRNDEVWALVVTYV